MRGQVLERGWKICERLRFPARLLQLAKKDVEGDVEAANTDLVRTLALSDRKLIQLARALIFDPEVLVIHFPTTFFADEQRRVVMSALRDFVDNRGLE